MQNSVSEYKVLATLFHPDRFDLIYKLRDEWFTDTRIKVLQSMRQCATEYGYITPEGVQNYYKGDLPGELFIDDTIQTDPIIAELKRLARKRKFYKAGQDLLIESEKDNPNAKDLELDLIEADYDTSLTLAGTQLLSEIQRKRSGDYQFIRSKLEFFNAMMGGEWERRAVSLILADPGVGKTALACDDMLSMASRGIKCCIFSLEMSKPSLLARMACNYGQIDADKLREGTLTNSELEYLQEIINKIDKLPIEVIDTDKGMNIAEICANIHQLARKGTQIFFIDHLQIIKLTTDDKHKELGDAVSKLKNLAKKYNIHISILSQKQNGKEGVWQVRDTGDAPTHADIIINMTVDEDSKNDTTKGIKMDFVKNRNGRTGYAPHLYNGEWLQFR